MNLRLKFTKSSGYVTVELDELRKLAALANESGNQIIEAESNHGGMVSVDMLKKANALRLELSRWKEVLK